MTAAEGHVHALTIAGFSIWCGARQGSGYGPDRQRHFNIEDIDGLIDHLTGDGKGLAFASGYDHGIQTAAATTSARLRALRRDIESLHRWNVDEPGGAGGNFDAVDLGDVLSLIDATIAPETAPVEAAS